MRRRIETLFGGRSWLLSVSTLFVIGLFLRLFRIYETATFLGDQGRDALVMYDIITLKHLPALGPITSVGSIFLGPLYYYMMAPWLAISLFNPIGPAIGVALINSISLPLQYLAVKEMIDKKVALLSVMFATFSWVLIEYSRFSWNPNLLPQVTFFSVYTLYKIVHTKKLRYFIAHGVLLSLAVQLHYLAVFLLPVTIVVLLINDLNEKKKTLLLHLGNTTVLGLSFILPFAPFIMFETLHSFPNVRSILHFSSTNSGASTTPFFTEVFTTVQNMMLYAFQQTIIDRIAALIILGLVTVFIVALKQKRALTYVVGPLLILIMGTSLYKGPKYAHYLGGMYILLYIIASSLLISLFKKSRLVGLCVTGILVALFLNVNVPKYYYLFEQEHQNQIDKARQTADTIVSMNPGDSFTLTSSPDAYADYPYRYFLRSMNHEAITKEADAYANPKNLFVVCETDCNPMNDPQWAVAHFNASGISSMKKVARYPWITVYKLSH